MTVIVREGPGEELTLAGLRERFPEQGYEGDALGHDGTVYVLKHAPWRIVDTGPHHFLCVMGTIAVRRMLHAEVRLDGVWLHLCRGDACGEVVSYHGIRYEDAKRDGFDPRESYWRDEHEPEVEEHWPWAARVEDGAFVVIDSGTDG